MRRIFLYPFPWATQLPSPPCTSSTPSLSIWTPSHPLDTRRYRRMPSSRSVCAAYWTRVYCSLVMGGARSAVVWERALGQGEPRTDTGPGRVYAAPALDGTSLRRRGQVECGRDLEREVDCVRAQCKRWWVGRECGCGVIACRGGAASGRTSAGQRSGFNGGVQTRTRRKGTHGTGIRV